MSLLSYSVACSMYIVTIHSLDISHARAVLDNLVKGAAGQALQNLNLMMGLPEETALLQQAMFP